MNRFLNRLLSQRLKKYYPKEMRPANLKTKIFLDSGDINETKEVIRLLGFLDGQTTNPTLISKNPDAQKRLEAGDKFTKEEILSFYKDVVKQVSSIIPNGSVSVEVYADKATTSEEMFAQGQGMFSWIANAHIKYPTTTKGLEAARRSIKQGMRVNMTLCFSQEQAAAVYAATHSTRYARSGQASLMSFKNVFVSPFVGRLDDRGKNGMDLVKNIIQMLRVGDHHVQVLTASVRSLQHLLYALKLGSDIITAPFRVLKEWGDLGMLQPSSDFVYHPDNLKAIPYEKTTLDKDWSEYNITHDLTDVGIERFSSDWNNLIKK